MAILNPITEGWALAPHTQTGERPLLHYYAGIGGLGGSFRSLCLGSTMPVRAEFFTTEQAIERDLAAGMCFVCKARLQRANRVRGNR